MAEAKKMKKTAQVLTLAVASILGLGAISMTSRTLESGKTDRNPVPQKITIYYGDVPVSLTADAFQSAFDPALLIR
jgi:hypothetical protein